MWFYTNRYIDVVFYFCIFYKGPLESIWTIINFRVKGLTSRCFNLCPAAYSEQQNIRPHIRDPRNANNRSLRFMKTGLVSGKHTSSPQSSYYSLPTLSSCALSTRVGALESCPRLLPFILASQFTYFRLIYAISKPRRFCKDYH